MITVRMEMQIKGEEEKEKLLNRLGLLFSRTSTITEFGLKWLYQLSLIDSAMGRVKIDEFVARTHIFYPYQMLVFFGFINPRDSVQKHARA